MPVTSIQFQSVDLLKRHLIAGVLAMGLFVLLLLAVLHVPGLAQWDAGLSAAVQKLRSPGVDRVMLIITMLGDLRLALLMGSIVLVSLLYQRRWWLAIHLMIVGIGSMLSVSIIKSTLARARPEVPDIVLDSFSFPSGHACTAAVAWGLVTLMLAYGRKPAHRRIIHAAGFATVAAIAFSRVYLHVHWTTDVVAGVALGYGLLAAFAWQLNSSAALRMPSLAKRLTIVCVLAVVYLPLSYQTQALRYAITQEQTAIETQAD